MSKYTTELRRIIESINDLQKPEGYNNTNELINNAIPQIFENFPIFDESYRNVLCHKILKHYYFYEIGFGTKGRFLFELNESLNRIMPYYNKLYLAWLQDFNPIYTQDLTTEHKGKSEDVENNISVESSKQSSDSISNEQNFGESENKNVSNRFDNSDDNTSNKRIRKYSDTPQGALTNIENDTYLSEAEIIEDTNNNNKTQISNDNSTDTSTSNVNNTSQTNIQNVNNVNRNDNNLKNNTNEYLDRIYGYGQSPAKTLDEYYKALINIDNLVIKDLADCFMMIF